MMEKTYISVILPLKLEWEPCYFVYTNDQHNNISIGDRVKVNFAGKFYIGIISGVNIEPQTDITKIKEAYFNEGMMDRITSDEIGFWRQVANYYMCTTGEVYKAAYPAGKTSMEEALYVRRHKEEEKRLKKEKEKEERRIRQQILAEDRHIKEITKLEQSAKRLKEQILKTNAKIEEIGNKIIRANERICAKEIRINNTTTPETREKYIFDKKRIEALIHKLEIQLLQSTDKLNGLSEKEAALTAERQRLASNPEYINNKSITNISENKKSDIAQTSPERQDNIITDSSTANQLILTPAQESACKQIKKGFDSGKPVLLHGITGSGKTEIYIKLAKETLARGKNVLYLVPEIALSRQLEERLHNHFKHNFFIFHSGQTAVRKRDIADSIRIISKNEAVSSESNTYIVLGTRSALFLPHTNLGLIIVDEEHDTSYKQDSPAPRYNGRDTALILAHGKSDIILGSATPSLEELYNCHTGRHILVKLNERYHGADDSDIEIIDTKAERQKRGMVGNFSKKLIAKINLVLENGGQVMILRSRRAWSTAVQCTECGEIVKCPHCNVSLSLHKNAEGEKMVCHYCGYTRPLMDNCPKCSGELTQMGTGTQKIENEVCNLFPHARIARLDSDSAKNKSFETETIKKFSKGEIDIIIGTQIVAKGFDFSNLQLVAVIAADSFLGMQDFRADEKAMQLLEQFRGRCGRRENKGTFAIQTSQPQHPVYQRIKHNDTDSLTYNLLSERKNFGFPPYTRIVEIQIKNKTEEKAGTTATLLANALRNGLKDIYQNNKSMAEKENEGCKQKWNNLTSSDYTITGPYTPIPDKIADNYIKTIRISLKKDKNLKHAKMSIKDIACAFEKKFDGQITINVDPV